MLSWRKIRRPSSPALAISARVRRWRSANSSRVKWSAICRCSPFFGEFGERALVERERLVARRPATLGHQLLHMVAHLVEPREPDAALGAHVVEQFQYRFESDRKSTRLNSSH